MDINFPFETNILVSLKGLLKDHSTEQLHSHDCHQVLVICRGTSLFEQNGYTLPQFGNTAAYIPPGVVHRSRVIGKNACYESLYFHKDSYISNIDEITIFKLSNLGANLIERLCQTSLLDLSDEINAISFSFFKIMLTEDLSNKVHNIHLPLPKSEQGQMICDYIHSNYRSQLQLSHFASVLPYTKRHISRIFVNEFGISIFTYLRMYRILMSTLKLQERKHSVTRIALDCGYESLSSFYTDFKKLLGCSPKEFQNQST